ncbi:MAG: NADPH-dependent FMN reductase [Elusimicrobia bacterium CG_4_9_14_3_um_filter_62_55]|nr:MAG: NADPH-dependent FMN reductase [Elusimicrobia bacterium CG22_combo_CG10-13_8_21_14_all_63_91]PJA16845.1 MAG: NADPH-dependent FMN reductase [Elusimicrobia bacterium CG_4_10_14_0_2_um_filter_63_34]PJB26314.1 MAG: NADPH-dependent FMN reductase [Elusimicrobia bacterium CG_4_9_14_3_um_filter_62_55]
MKSPPLRKQDPYQPLTKDEFRERFYNRFQDPAYDKVQDELERVFETAWDGYIQYRKSPRVREGGEGFADPKQKLSTDWLAAREAILAAQRAHENPKSPSRILLVLASTRSEHSCPGEISKTRRLIQVAREAIESRQGFEVDLLDLSSLADEPWKVIHPCKACVSTAMPLCHWPCSCYPNHAMGQTNDWMNELYPRWTAAHGVMIICPVHWYQAPAPLKLMIDRLVCADGGNPDPTTTHGKDPAKAKELELKGWDYPKHLAGRAFSVVTHADAAGAENLRRMLSDWLSDIGMVQAGPSAVLDTFIGYYKPYATSHEDLDADKELPIQVRNAALSLTNMVTQLRSGAYRAPDEGLTDPREK